MPPGCGRAGIGKGGFGGGFQITAQGDRAAPVQRGGKILGRGTDQIGFLHRVGHGGSRAKAVFLGRAVGGRAVGGRASASRRGCATARNCCAVTPRMCCLLLNGRFVFTRASKCTTGLLCSLWTNQCFSSRWSCATRSAWLPPREASTASARHAEFTERTARRITR